jgi:hypothetical protein
MGTEPDQQVVVVVEMRQVVRGDRLLFFCGNRGCQRVGGRLYRQTRLLASTARVAPVAPTFTDICPRCGSFNALDLEAVARAMTVKEA